MRVVVVGGGVFGVTGALALARAGHEVALLDPGPLPHPLAESTDVSKVVRMDYGADEDYLALGERALDGWRRWNHELPVDPGGELFHETGVAFLTPTPMAPGGFEGDSFALLERRGHRPERVDAAAIARRFPAFRGLCDGYVNPEGGWAEAGRVVARLAQECARAGVTVRGDVAVARLIVEHDRASGVVTGAGEHVPADAVVVAAGAWTPKLVPWLAPHLRAVGQPVFHLAPADPAAYAAPRFPVFGAGIAQTGWYGFPATRDGVVKIANHGVGVVVDPAAERATTPAQEAALRAFLAGTLPGLAAAPIVHRRLCVYCDTLDEHFWIAPDPAHAGLVVATGGSGHAFKFAPLLGDWIARALAGDALPRFRWRTDLRAPHGKEAARHR